MCMCSINHELKAIYIHIPKCGGLYVQKILEACYNFKTLYFTHEKHSDFINASDIISQTQYKGFLTIKKQGVLRYFMSSSFHSENANITQEQWDTYYKFTFIRNPYDKVISAWKYLNKTNNTNILLQDFIISKNTCDNYTFFHTFITQYEHLKDIRDTLNINYCGRFENLNEDLLIILIELGITKFTHKHSLINNIKINKSDKSEIYTSFYDVDSLQIVNSLFEDDFKYLQFKKCNTIEELTDNSKLYYVFEDQFLLNNINLIKQIEKLGFEMIDTANTNNNSNNNANNNTNNNNFINNNSNNTIVLNNGLVLTAVTPVNKQQNNGMPKIELGEHLILAFKALAAKFNNNF